MADFLVKSNFELKDVDEKTGIVTGFCAIMGNIDSDNDMIMPDAFTKTINERGPKSSRCRIKHLWQHDSWQPIAIPLVLEERERGMQSMGLYFESKFGKDHLSQDRLQQHIDGIITELSIGYNTVRAEDINDENGKFKYRKLIELKLWEYSSVTWAANELARIVSAKGESKEVINNLNKRMDALSKGLKNNKYTDETCEQFETEIEKIKAIFKSLNVTAPGDSSTQTIIAPIDSSIEELNYFLKSIKS